MPFDLNNISVYGRRVANPLYRVLRDGVSHSALALALACGALNPADAANYTAGTELELKAAIEDANNDGDAASTITLAGTFTITGNSLPAVTKNLTINIGTNVLVSAGPTVFNVAAGAELKVDGSLRLTGTPGFSTSGRLQKDGEGTLTITGGPSIYAWYMQAVTGDIVIKDGANVQIDSKTGPSTSLSTGQSTITVTDTGTVVRDLGGSNLGTTAGATLNILAGAHYINGTAMSLASSDGSIGTVNVRGSDSLLDGSLTTSRGLGIVNVTEAGRIASTNTLVGGSAVLIDQGGAAQFLVSGDGSRWDNSGTFTIMRGTLDVLDGGVVRTSILRMATVTSKSAQTASIRVSGAGSELITTSAAANAFQIAGGPDTGAKEASLTIANGGKVTVGASGAGTINMATTATARGVLNIGGAEGQAATGAGILNAGKLMFGPGTSIVNFNHTDASYAFDVALDSNSVPNNGTLNHIGSGKTVLTANQTLFTGQTNVYAGALAVNGTLGGTMDVFGGRLQGIGRVGDTINHLGGVIAPGNSIGTLTVAGNYTSNGGALEIEAELGDDSSRTDLLVITGDSILGTGPTQVRVINVGGLGAETTADGIRIVEVQGLVSDADAFVLNGPAIGGVYSYKLFQNDIATGLDGDWYLRSAGLAPTIPVYENYPQVLLGMVALPTLEQRVGDRVRNAINGENAVAAEKGIWTRIEAAHGHVEANAFTTSASYDSDTALVQVGFDGQLSETAAGTLIGGLTAQYARASADIFSSLGDGGNTTDSYGIGANLTWYGENGFYVDGQAQVATLRSDLSAAGVGEFGDGIRGSGYALSLEAGREIPVNGAWSLTPQAQLAYSSVDFDAFTDPFGANVSLRQGESLKGRLGVAVNYDSEATKSHVYGIANLTYEFLDGTSVAVSGIDLSFEPQRFSGELGMGGTYKWAGGKYALHGEALASTSFVGSHALKGTVGYTTKF